MSTKWLGIEGRTGVGERAAVWDLAAEARAASHARALTTETLRAWRVTDPADIDDIVLMVDELVTNAIVHGDGPVSLRLRLEGHRLVGEISDGNPEKPGGPTSPPLMDWAEAGRGLLLVSALATDFGCRPEGDGKTVWFARLLHGATNGATCTRPTATADTADTATGISAEMPATFTDPAPAAVAAQADTPLDAGPLAVADMDAPAAGPPARGPGPALPGPTGPGEPPTGYL